MNSNVLKDPSKILRVLPLQFARLFSAEHLAFDMAFLNLSMVLTNLSYYEVLYLLVLYLDFFYELMYLSIFSCYFFGLKFF